MHGKHVESLYATLPEWGQTAALNLYGLRNRDRLSRWNQILARLSQTERSQRVLRGHSQRSHIKGKRVRAG